MNMLQFTSYARSVKNIAVVISAVFFCSGCTTLFSAACDGETDNVREILQKGTAVNQGRELWCASSHGHADIVQLLLQYHADPNKRFQDHENDIPLIAAANSGSPGIVTVLLDHGALVDASDKEGKTALAVAALREHRAIVELLLSRGADVEIAQSYLKKFAGTNTYCNLLSNNARVILEKCKKDWLAAQSAKEPK